VVAALVAEERMGAGAMKNCSVPHKSDKRRRWFPAQFHMSNRTSSPFALTTTLLDDVEWATTGKQRKTHGEIRREKETKFS
jgi:hypothetical protein